ncbi:TIGR03643 family protein [Pedobacter sp. JCM 36344]|uniref:TIGR03643 family protein n=1 Tax=Pedobacter sp. JCM 36344 TaxID=3374280 RepID=UPI0039782DBB
MTLQLNKITETSDLSVVDTDRIIEMAWEDRTSFDAIRLQFGLSEQQVIRLMRKEMKASSFKLWRERVHGRATKHEMLGESSLRFKCSLQKQISYNKISKRR